MISARFQREVAQSTVLSKWLSARVVSICGGTCISLWIFLCVCFYRRGVFWDVDFQRSIHGFHLLWRHVGSGRYGGVLGYLNMHILVIFNFVSVVPEMILT